MFHHQRHHQHGHHETTYIRANNGKFVCSQNGEKPMECSAPHTKEWEHFTIEELGNGKVALKCMGKYVSSENGEHPMTCNRDSVGPWEMFEMITHPDGSFSFKGNNGKYVCSENGEKPMTCTAPHMKEWEMFHSHQ
jgi:hypothetical protein